jgi:hypothetical protein
MMHHTENSAVNTSSGGGVFDKAKQTLSNIKEAAEISVGSLSSTAKQYFSPKTHENNPPGINKLNLDDSNQDYDKISIATELPGASSTGNSNSPRLANKPNARESYSFNVQQDPYHNRTSSSTLSSARSSVSVPIPSSGQFYTNPTANTSPASTAHNTPRQSFNNFHSDANTTANTPQHSNLPSPALSAASTATTNNNSPNMANASFSWNNAHPNNPHRRFSAAEPKITNITAAALTTQAPHSYYTPQAATRRIPITATATDNPNPANYAQLPPPSQYWLDKSRSNSLSAHPAESSSAQNGSISPAKSQSLTGRSDCPAGVVDPREPVDPLFAAQLAAAEAEDAEWRKQQKIDDNHTSPVPDFSDFIKG